MDRTQLIKELRKKLYSKPAPGEVLNTITDQKVRELAPKYDHNHNALWIGTYIADLFIWEAKETGDIKKHVPMAVKYAKKLIKKENINEEEAEIILEIIETHHGGKQKHIESKIYKNADCFKFLNPKGAFHIFSAFYKGNSDSMKDAFNYAMFKAKNKYELVDLSKELKAEAKELYEHWKALADYIGHEIETPDLYK